MNSLPEMYRQVLTLYYLGGMTCREIARFLGKSPTAIRQRLSRARTQLREEVLAMTTTTFEGQRLQASFTFRIVEAVRRIKVHPMPRMAGLPWGLSLAAGIIITVMSLNPHIVLQNPTSMPAGSLLSRQAKVLKTGEIPVDILNTSQIPAISSNKGSGDGGSLVPSVQQRAFFLAPSAEDGTWTRKADMPTPRWALSTSMVNGKIYAIGGTDVWIGTTTQGLQTVEEYDPATDTWRKRADMPTARYWFSTSVVDAKIHAIGGWDGTMLHSTVEEYDPVTDTWTRKADMPTPRWALSTSMLKRKIYAIGGGEPLSIVEEYDPATDIWTRKADMPTPRFWFTTSAVNGKIYAIGGKQSRPPQTRRFR